MVGFSLRDSRSAAVLPGLLIGIVLGLWLTVPRATLKSAPEHPDVANEMSPPELEKLSPAEFGKLTLKEMARLCARTNRGKYSSLQENPSHNPELGQQIQLGLDNLRRLLPLARILTVASLREAQAEQRLIREEHLINRVKGIVLDPQLENTAEIVEGKLSEIRVSPDYALHLTADDEAIFLLGHELTHVAARGGRLKHFVENLRQTTRQNAGVNTDEEQKEDLACDFIGAQVLKRFIAQYPTDKPASLRLARVIGYGSPSERLAQAWLNFCDSYAGIPADSEHLSQAQTINALAALDPDFKALIPSDSDVTICR